MVFDGQGWTGPTGVAGYDVNPQIEKEKGGGYGCGGWYLNVNVDHVLSSSNKSCSNRCRWRPN